MTTQKNSTQKKAEKTERKPRTLDTRPANEIFAERFNEELRLMSRRYDNLRTLASARKAHGQPGQVEAGIKWMEEQLADVARLLRESVNRAQDEAGGKPAFKPIVPVSAPETPTAPASG